MRVSPEDDIVQSPKLFECELIKDESGANCVEKKKPVTLDDFISDNLFTITKNILGTIGKPSFFHKSSAILIPESLWGRIRWENGKVRTEFFNRILADSSDQQSCSRIADRCLTGMFDGQGALIENHDKQPDDLGGYIKACALVSNTREEIAKLPSEDSSIFLRNALGIVAKNFGKESNAWAAQNYVDAMFRTMRRPEAVNPTPLHPARYFEPNSWFSVDMAQEYISDVIDTFGFAMKNRARLPSPDYYIATSIGSPSVVEELPIPIKHGYAFNTVELPPSNAVSRSRPEAEKLPDERKPSKSDASVVFYSYPNCL